jgi:hypothetical protein
VFSVACYWGVRVLMQGKEGRINGVGL